MLRQQISTILLSLTSPHLLIDSVYILILFTKLKIVVPNQLRLFVQRVYASTSASLVTSMK